MACLTPLVTLNKAGTSRVGAKVRLELGFGWHNQ